MSGIVWDGAEVIIPGVNAINYLADDAIRLGPGNGNQPTHGGAGKRRSKSITHLVMHTTRGIPGGSDKRAQVIIPGVGPASTHARDNARYWSRTSGDKAAGAALIIGYDATVLCTCDLKRMASWHAGPINDVSIGAELVQTAKVELWTAQSEALRLVYEWCATTLGLPRTVQWPYRGKQSAVATLVGHRDLTTNRGKGDPGDAVYEHFIAAGWAPVDAVPATP